MPIWLAALGLLLAALACTPGSNPSGPARAVLEPDRRGHFLDRPFPSDELLTREGTVDLSGFPVAGYFFARNYERGWIRQVGRSVRGFSALGPIYFRFTAAIAPDPYYEGKEDDAIRLVSLDSDHRVPVHVRFVSRSGGDPYLPNNTLIVAPDESHPLRSGERYLAIVADTLAKPPKGWAPPPEAPDAAIATAFTVQDNAGELRTLGLATDELLDANPEWLEPSEGLRLVRSLRYEPGETPSGNPATRETVVFADGGTEVTYLGRNPGALPQRFDLEEGPFEVYQASIQVPVFQDPDGRPYQSIGWDRLDDWTRDDGEIRFGPGARLESPAHPETVRVVVQVPTEGDGHAILLWGHGSGGDAYEAINRSHQEFRIPELRKALAEAGAAIVSTDLPQFGQRFPLVERGYTPDQGFVNVGNPIAMRDGPRQAAAEQRALYRFATEVLPELIGSGRLDPRRVGAIGHSTGAQVTALAAVLQDDGGPDALLLSVGGGFLSNYALETQLLALPLRLETRFGLLDLGTIEPRQILGFALGVPRGERGRIDRHHPALVPFQLLVEGADPLAVAPHQPRPVWVLAGRGDRRVPADSSRWLAQASSQGRLVSCQPRGDYDGHSCPLREAEAREVFEAFARGLAAPADARPPKPRS